MSKELNHSNNFLLYTNENDEVKVDVLLKDESIWLTINQLAELFGIDKSGVSRHIKNIYDTGELAEKATVAKIATVQNESGREVTRQLDFFDLFSKRTKPSRSRNRTPPFGLR